MAFDVYRADFVLDENFHGWRIMWLGMRNIPKRSGWAYEFGYLSYITATRDEETVVAVVRPGGFPFITYLSGRFDVLPRIDGDVWSPETRCQRGRWDTMKHHVSAPAGWYEPMAVAYEALQTHLLGGTVPALKGIDKAIARVYQSKTYWAGQADEIWGAPPHGMKGWVNEPIGGKATADKPRRRETELQRLLDRHYIEAGEGSGRCEWARCMDGLNNCCRSSGIGYVYSLAEAEKVGACCPCTCGADAHAMADQITRSDKTTRKTLADLAGLLVRWDTAVQLGRKKRLRYDPPGELYEEQAVWWGLDTGQRWQHAPTVPLVGNLGRFGTPDLFRYAEAA